MRRRLVVLALFCPFVLTAKAPLIAPGGLYVLINRANLLDMTVLGGHSSDGTRVTQAAVAGEAADLWKFETAGEAYRIVGMGGSSFALDAGEGRLSVRSSTGSPSQLWSVEESEPGFVRIENKSRGCFLSAPVADNINAPLVCLEATAPKVPTTRSEWMLYRFDGESARALYPVLIEKIRRNMAAAKDKDRGEQTRQILIETIIHQVIHFHEESDYTKALDAARRLSDEFPGLKDFYFHEAAASSAFYMGSRELGAGRYPSARAFFQLADKFRKLDKNLAEDARFRNIPHFVRLAERRAAMGAIKPEFTNRFLVLCIARAESESSRKTGRDFPGVDYRTTRQDFEAIQSLEGAMRTMVEVYTGGRMSLEFQNHYVDGVLRDTRASGESVVTADLNEIDPPLTDILYEEIDKSDSVWILWNASGSIGGPGPGVREYPLIPYSGLNLPMRGYLEGPTKNRNVSYFMYAWLQTLLARTGATAGQDPARAFPEAASLSAEDMFEYILGKHIPRTLDSKGWSKDGLGWRHLSYREEYRLNIPKDAWLKLSKRILGISVDARKDSQVLLRQAEEALKSGDTQTADLCYARALDKNPSLSGPRRYNAERAEKSGNWNAGAAHYADLFEVTGDWHWAQKAGELFLFRMKNEKDGDHYLQTALDLAWKTEDRAAIRDRWTAYYLDKGDLEKAARMRAKEVNYRAPVSDRMRPGMKLAGQRGIRVIRGRTISLSSVPAVSPKEY